MNAPHNTIDPLFSPLLPVFFEELVKRRNGLFAIIEATATAPMQSAHLDEARFLAHKVTGSSSPFGYTDLGLLGEKLENLIRSDPTNLDEIAECIKTLVNACDEILDNRPKTANPPAAPHATPAIPPERIIKSRPSVLVVDDDPVVRGMLNTILDETINVETCASAAQAFALIVEDKPDLVLLDDQLSERISGLTLLSKIKNHPTLSSVPVIMITANSRADSVMRALAEGAADYILKPLHSKQVLERISDFIKRSTSSVLIADDDPTIRGLLEHRFRSTGCRVLLAEEGEQAFNIIETEIPSLVLLDRMMPGLDGASVLQRLRENPALRETPVIFLTAKHMEQDVIEGLELGAVDYIVKPFNPNEVVSRCLRYLRPH